MEILVEMGSRVRSISGTARFRRGGRCLRTMPRGNGRCVVLSSSLSSGLCPMLFRAIDYCVVAEWWTTVERGGVFLEYL